MELKATPHILDVLRPELRANPLHGVESHTTVYAIISKKMWDRIHYMELKAEGWSLRGYNKG